MNEVVGARCWWLPTAEGAGWLVPEKHEPGTLARTLGGRTQILAASRPTGDSMPGFESAAGKLLWRITRAAHEAYFRAVSRSLTAGAWVFSSFMLSRLPSELRIVGWVLLVPGLLFSLYVLAAYVWPALRWVAWRAGTARALMEAGWEENGLCARMAEALRFRKGLTLEQRGRLPDKELLDTDAYRKLVAEGVTTTEELKRLGHGIAGALGVTDGEPVSPKVAELADRNGIDMGSTLFYLDFVSAVRKL